MKTVFTLTFIIAVLCTNFTVASDTKTDESQTQRKELIEKAVDFLRKQQAQNGSFSAKAGVGPTGVVVAGLLEVGVSPSDPMVKKGLGFLQNAIREDGGIYTEGGMVSNYETCIAIMCFTAANNMIKAEDKLEKGPYDELLAKCEKYIRANQFTEDRGKTPEDMAYGGAGYGKHERPDLSNTQFFVEALKTAGAKDDDPAIQKALVFVSRCQNLESQHNTTSYAGKNPDGGFIYTCVGEGESPAGTTSDDPDVTGGLRSYGSMTYAGLKSLIYAGLTKDDIRYKAAYDWLQKNYSLLENPGLGKMGLYYYYQTMAKTLAVLGSEVFESADGVKHDWKSEVIKTLAEKQNADGSWTNTEARWMENDPNLVTGYVLLVLGQAYCRPE
ncbi:MAG: prenyltransferase/squalene oxidase repeat-containing protein [Thermoguttaceae bacterium]